MAVKWALHRKAEEFGDCIAECGVRKKKGRKKKKERKKDDFLDIWINVSGSFDRRGLGNFLSAGRIRPVRSFVLVLPKQTNIDINL